MARRVSGLCSLHGMGLQVQTANSASEPGDEVAARGVARRGNGEGVWCAPEGCLSVAVVRRRVCNHLVWRPKLWILSFTQNGAEDHANIV